MAYVAAIRVRVVQAAGSVGVRPRPAGDLLLGLGQTCDSSQRESSQVTAHRHIPAAAADVPQ